ncbi:MAG: transposase [Proteobacteria bacterium]|nr:transposase [Pseudomonadota bacterium]
MLAGDVVSRGCYRRKFDGRKIRRFFCRVCKKSFSAMTGSPTHRQHKPAVNQALAIGLCAGVSQRRLARQLNINKKTVARKLIFLGKRARLIHEAYLNRRGKVVEAQFDDMESSVHSKMKPVSIPIAVEKNTREIIAIGVAEMPAKGHLAAKSRKKYGLRNDARPKERATVLATLGKLAGPQIVITSDKCPQYPALVSKIIPTARHIVVQGRRGCVVGQGELKRGGNDPLFSLNHTAAMLRANINRLVRRTWCTSKRQDRLKDHLDLYVWYHNHYLIKNPARKNPVGPLPSIMTHSRGAGAASLAKCTLKGSS